VNIKSAQIQEFLEKFTANQQNIYSYGGALTFSIYDILLSSGKEVKYIWGSKLSPVTILYFFVRYFSVINLISIVAIRASTGLSLEVCRRYYFWVIIGVCPAIILALDAILLLRIFALYQRSKQVFTMLLILVLTTFGGVLWAHLKLAIELHDNAIPAPPSPWQGCATKIPKLTYMLLAYVPDFALSLLFLGMTLWKLVASHQEMHGKLTLKSLRKLDRVSPLLLAFARDGSIFFALSSVITFLKIVTVIVSDELRQPGFYPWLFALDSFAGSHLILDLRAAGWRRNADQTWRETMSVRYWHSLVPYEEPI